MTSLVGAVTDRVLASRKYRFVCRPVVERLAADALSRDPGLRESAKAVKRKLHQVYGAFHRVNYPRLAGLIDSVTRDPRTAEQVGREIAAMHVSTAERMSFAADLYPPLLEAARPEVVLDVGCGLHPFLLPWMGLAPNVAYHAMDIDMELMRNVDRYLGAIGRAGAGVAGDAVSGLPDLQPDLVFLLKMIPSLERQRPGSGTEAILRYPESWVVLSVPRRSLGGRDRGMDENYDRLLVEVTRDADRTHRILRFPTESVWLCPPLGC